MSSLLDQEGLFVALGLPSSGFSLEQRCRLLRILSIAGRLLRTRLLSTTSIELVISLQSSLQCSTFVAEQLTAPILGRLESLKSGSISSSSSKAAASSEVKTVKAPEKKTKEKETKKEKPKKKKGKGDSDDDDDSDADEDSSSDSSDSDDSDSSSSSSSESDASSDESDGSEDGVIPMKKKLYVLKKGKKQTEFKPYANMFAKLESKYKAKWTGYSTMRVLKHAITKGTFLAVFSFNQSTFSNSCTCIGVCPFPWPHEGSDTLFGMSGSSGSGAFFQPGTVRTKGSTVYGNPSFSSTEKGGEMIVGLVVHQEKKQSKSHALLVMRGMRQSIYLVNLPTKAQIGVSGGRPDGEVTLLRDVQLRKSSLKKRKGDTPVMM